MTVTADIVTAITGHHDELESTLNTRVDAVIDAARTGALIVGPVAELRGLLDHDIVPHARAEEEVLYAAATAGSLQPLVGVHNRPVWVNRMGGRRRGRPGR